MDFQCKCQRRNLSPLASSAWANRPQAAARTTARTPATPPTLPDTQRVRQRATRQLEALALCEAVPSKLSYLRPEQSEVR